MPNRVSTFFRHHLLTPIAEQLKQGATPADLARTVASGVSLAIFPLLGTTTALCVFAGIRWKLNQPILQAVNYLLYPLQLLLLPVFLMVGAKVTGSEPISFHPEAIAHEFTSDPRLFFAKYGMAGLHGVMVWIVVAPILFFLVNKASYALFSHWGKSK
jgi:uncharacterized protein (DUF2062 family)